MHIFTKIALLRAFLKEIKAQNKLIGFVPTMGALHNGHLSLIAESRLKTEITVCSIFVNPTQFSSETDLEKYPQNISSDSELLQKAGCDVLFCPDVSEMYPDKPAIEMRFKVLDQVQEGVHRLGHFNGVALIVTKLFHIVSPDFAFFGQKDLQQCLIIRQLVNELNFDIRIAIIPTVRESDGLAMSSRNQRLNTDERKRAISLFKALTFAREALLKREAWSEIMKQVNLIFEKHQTIPEYFELVDSSNLSLIVDYTQVEHPVICVSALVGEIRLIDNIFIHENS